MYAIVEISGKQFKVEKDQKIYVDRLSEKEGDNISLDKVFLLEEKGKIDLGSPIINGAFVEAKIVKHLKGDKVIVFKKKRRKGYRVKNGYRPSLTELDILDIKAKGLKKKAEKSVKKAEEKKDAEKKVVSKKAAPKKAAPKKVVSKKDTSKKVVSKKATPKKVVSKKAAPKKVDKKVDKK